MEPFGRQTAISRFNEGGSADLIFGTKILPWPVPPVVPEAFSNTHPPAACLRSDGHLLVAESYAVNENGGPLIDSAGRIYCFDSQGNPDLNFNGTGMVEVRFAEQTQIFSIAILPDERFIIFGLSDRPSMGIGLSRATLACYHRDGTLDTTFANGGQWKNSEYTVFGSMVLDNNKIVVAIAPDPNVDDNPYIQIHRFLNDGMSDPLFNGGGAVAVQMDTYFLDTPIVSVQADKKILVAGTYDYPDQRLYWMRIDETGALDSTFANEGIALHAEGVLEDVIVQHASSRMIVVSNMGKTINAGAKVPKILGVQL